MNDYPSPIESFDNPLVSVIIPAFNHEKYVQKAIKSVIDQTYNNIELIVLNDGSKDDTHQQIISMEVYCKNRFTSFAYINKNNEGLTITLNKGITLAKGDFISLLASDDMFLPDKIEFLVKEFNALDNNYALVSGDTDFIDADDNCVEVDLNGNIANDKTRLSFNSSIRFLTYRRINYDLQRNFGTYESFFEGNYFSGLAALIRKSSIIEMGLYDINTKLEDIDMWFRLSKKYKFKYVDKVLAHYRWHENSKHPRQSRGFQSREPLEAVFSKDYLTTTSGGHSSGKNVN
ncbi:glycosyltransferase [Geobacter sp. SVR]|uniref:glycosyltransferase n=1 Tax=Geobacter sp. SVR TaxID=2495594 RepID=UPI001950EA9A|nr:glycosyltransferase [Geobacter sp. SVR]BCS55009.1 glycosyl transferase [Geobacter sp. SVR]